MAKVLVIRLSAIGDVAMTIPVIYSVAKANPQDTFTILTQTFLIPVFINKPANINILGINTRGTERSLRGLLLFASALVKYDYDRVLDLHDVIRTKIIRFLFCLKGTPVLKIHKNRKNIKQLIRRENKIRVPARPVVEAYADVFRKAGFAFDITFASLFDRDHPANMQALHSGLGEKQGRWIGIAPFAKHRGKIYPTDYMEQVIEELSKEEGITIFLFGGRGYEEAMVEQWAYQYPHVKSVIGRYSLDSELALISRLDLLLSMDSANMHFASLVGTRVLSIWGATHPYTGFYGYRQKPEDAIQLDELTCRPCSVYGKKECFRKDWACMAQLPPEIVVEKIKKLLTDEDRG